MAVSSAAGLLGKVKIMLEYNVNINGNTYFPPLIAAIESGEDEVVNFLLDENADYLITYDVC